MRENPRYHHCVHVKFTGKPLAVFAECEDCGASWELIKAGDKIRGWERNPLLGRTKKYNRTEPTEDEESFDDIYED